MRQWLTLVFVLPYIFVAAQKEAPSFEVTGQLLAIDQLQQVYTKDSLQTLRKYDSNGQLLFEYQNQNLGDLSTCDANDPFGILLFYPDFNTLILLDRTLNPLSEIQLDVLSIYGAKVVATSIDKQIWLYDQQDFTLKKISRQGRILQESADLSRWIDNNFQAKRLVVQANAIFLHSKHNQLLKFSPFGQFEKEIRIEASYFFYQQGLFYYCADEAGLFIWEPIQGKVKYLIQTDASQSYLLARPKMIAIQYDQQISWASW